MRVLVAQSMSARWAQDGVFNGRELRFFGARARACFLFSTHQAARRFPLSNHESNSSASNLRSRFFGEGSLGETKGGVAGRRTSSTESRATSQRFSRSFFSSQRKLPSEDSSVAVPLSGQVERCATPPEHAPRRAANVVLARAATRRFFVSRVRRKRGLEFGLVPLVEPPAARRRREAGSPAEVAEWCSSPQ